MNEYKIYLVYSPQDLPYDREALGNYIRAQNDILRRNGSPCYLYMVECEDVDTIPEDTALVISLSLRYSGGTRLLQQLWERKADVAVIPFFRSGITDAEPEVEELKQWLRSENCYWQEYPDVANVTLMLQQHLQKWARHLFAYTIREGDVYLGSTVLIRRDDFACMRENEQLQQLEKRIEEITQQLEQLHRSDDFEQIRQLWEQRGDLEKQRDQIVSTAYELMEPEESNLTELHRQAQNAVLRGDVKEALEMLPLEKLQQQEQAAQTSQMLQGVLQLYLLRANVLQLQVQDSNSASQVLDTLLPAVALEQREKLGINSQMELIRYLHCWVSAKEALKQAQQMLPQLTESIAPQDLAAAWQLYGKVYLAADAQTPAGYEAYDRALQLWQQLYEEDPGYFTQWANCCNEIATVAVTHSKQQNALADRLLAQAYSAAEEIYASEPDAARIMLAELSMTRGDRCVAIGENIRATEYYDQAEAWLVEMADEEQPETELLQVKLQLRYGWLYLNIGNHKETVLRLTGANQAFAELPAQVADDHAKILFYCYACLGYTPAGGRTSLELALQYLDRTGSPDRNEQCELAKIYAAMGVTYALEGNTAVAEEYWKKARWYCSLLEQEYAGASLLSRIFVLRFIGDGYLYLREQTGDQTQKKNAQEAFTQAVELHEQLENGDYRAGAFTWTLFAKYLGALDLKNAEFCKALVKRLKKFEPYPAQQTDMQHAVYCSNYANLYRVAKKYREAAGYYRKAMECYWEYVEKNPEKRTPYLIEWAVRYSTCLEKIAPNYKKAEEVLQKTLEALEVLKVSRSRMDQIGVTLCKYLLELYQRNNAQKPQTELKRKYDRYCALLRMQEDGRK